MIDFIKEGLTWLDVDLVRNEVQHVVPAMDPEEFPDRTGMKYFLDLDLPEFSTSSNFETMIRLEGREKPPILSAGAFIYEGCSFRIEELLASQLRISLPIKNNIVLSAVASLTTKYRIREIIEPALLDRYLPVRTAMRAGLAVRDFVGYEHSFFSRYQAENKQFLTWHPNNKVVSVNQREYLYFLLNMSPLPEVINLRIRETKQDGTRSVSTVSSITGLSAFQVICCQVGCAVLALDQDVLKYDVWLADGNNERFSEVRTYHIDRRVQAFERFLLFSNSFGVFDTLRLTGVATQETDVSKSTSKKERVAGKGLDFSELEVISITENSGIKLSTGLFEEQATTYLDYLRELMLSEVILQDTSYGYEAMNLITSNLEYSKDRPGLIERTFELERTYSDKNYSRMLPAVKLPGRETVWRGLSAKYVLDSFGKRTGQIVFERLRLMYADDNSKVIPYAIKLNLPGDADYIDPIPDVTVTPGTTPYPSIAISRPGTFSRNNCAAGYLGQSATISIPAGTYGGELEGEADLLAEARFSQINTQEYANNNGVCNLNNTPVKFAILHKIPMTGSWVTGSDKYGPNVSMALKDVGYISGQAQGVDPAVLFYSLDYHMPGIYTIMLQVSYGNYPKQACKLRIASKNREVDVFDGGTFVFENVKVTSLDAPLVIEVIKI